MRNDGKGRAVTRGSRGQHEAVGKRRLSLRLRIALTTAVLIMATGALVLGSVYFYMRFAPDYALVPEASAASSTVKPTSVSSPVTVEPSATPSPLPSATSKKSTHPEQLKKPPIRSVSDILSTLLAISLVAFVALSILGALIAWFVAGRLLTPLRRLSEEVAATSADSLASPIEATGPQDEVRALTESVNEMKARLNASFQSERRFAANASHELKTPLIASQALLDVALDEPIVSPDAGEPDTRQLLQQLRGLTHQSLTTLDSLLDLAEATSVPLQCAPVDMSALVGGIAAQLTPLAIDDGLTFDTVNTEPDCAPGDAWVDGDETLLAVMVRNLIANAIQHNVAGGQVSVAVTTDAGNVVVRVENDGAVLTNSQVEQLTEPFYRVAGRVHSARGRGHGLGLALAKAVVEAHKGRLNIAARPQGGLTVEASLPATMATETKEGVE